MKTYVIHSGYTNTIVGKIYDNGESENNLTCELLCPDDRFDFPVDLFGPFREWERDDTATITRWLESRVVPRTRQFLDDMLYYEKMDKWDLDKLLKLNGGHTSNDKFSVEIIEEA